MNRFTLALLCAAPFVFAQPWFDSGNAKKIQGRPVSATAPTNGETLVYNSTTKTWGPGAGSAAAPAAGTGISVAGSTVSIDTTLTATRPVVQAGADEVCTDAGGDDTYVCTLAYPLAAYPAGKCFSLIVTTGNTGTASVNMGPSVVSVFKATGAALSDGDIVASGAINRVCYDGAAMRLAGGGTSVSATPPYLTIGGIPYTSDGFAVTLPPTTGWTADNCGACTFTTSGFNGAILLVGGTANPAIFSQTRAIGATRTLIAKIAMSGNASSSSTSACGIGVVNTALTKYRILGPFVSNTAAGITDLSFDPNATSFNFESPIGPGDGTTVLKIVIGTNYTASVSNDGGLNFQDVYTATYSTIFGGVVANTDLWTFTSKTNGQGFATKCTLLSWSAA